MRAEVSATMEADARRVELTHGKVVATAHPEMAAVSATVARLGRVDRDKREKGARQERRSGISPIIAAVTSMGETQRLVSMWPRPRAIVPTRATVPQNVSA
jgi:hypothetical protein